jgi:hypothetical protein
MRSIRWRMTGRVLSSCRRPILSLPRPLRWSSHQALGSCPVPEGSPALPGIAALLEGSPGDKTDKVTWTLFGPRDLTGNFHLQPVDLGLKWR